MFYNLQFALHLFGALLLHAILAPVQARCFNSGSSDLPKVVTFADGQQANISDRSQNTLRYAIVKSGATQNESSIKSGLLPLQVVANGMTTVFEWTDALPEPTDLSVGKSLTLKALMRGGTRPHRPFSTQITVLAADTLSVENCQYPVLKILQEDKVGTERAIAKTRFFHVPSMLSLKTIIEFTDLNGVSRIVEHRVLKLE
jgi:hypothetical protein